MLEATVEYLNNPLTLKFVQSGILFVLFLIVLIGVRLSLRKMKADGSDRLQIQKWSLFILILLFFLILFRIWGGSRFLRFVHPQIRDNAFYSLLAFALIYTALYFIRRFINSLQINLAKRHEYRKRAGYAAAFVFIFILIPIWAGNSTNWATVFSVMGAGIAVALHDVLLNLAGWFYISLRRPYRTGERIEIDGLKGDVIDVGVLQTTLLEIGNWVDGDQSTGRVVHLPHGQVFRKPLYNFTQGFEFIWNEISVLVTFESNWETAKAILLECGEEASRDVQHIVKRKIDRMAREYLIYYKNFSPYVYVKIEESGVKLTLRYLTEAKKRRGGTHVMSEKILKVVAAAKDVEFAYPTYRLYRQGEAGSSHAPIS